MGGPASPAKREGFWRVTNPNTIRKWRGVGSEPKIGKKKGGERRYVKIGEGRKVFVAISLEKKNRNVNVNLH